MKRENYITWEQFFMGVAVLASMRSKDPSCQVGACIVDSNNMIISTGYNGFPRLKSGSDNDDTLPWDKHDIEPSKTKYSYVVHAEANAIINAKQDLSGCSLYVTWFPCCECAKLIIQSGICKVVYENEHNSERYENSIKAAKTMFYLSGIIFQKF